MGVIQFDLALKHVNRRASVVGNANSKFGAQVDQFKLRSQYDESLRLRGNMSAKSPSPTNQAIRVHKLKFRRSLDDDNSPTIELELNLNAGQEVQRLSEAFRRSESAALITLAR